MKFFVYEGIDERVISRIEKIKKYVNFKINERKFLIFEVIIDWN